MRKLSGTLSIPGSKSHTIRALLIAALAEGESVLHTPLPSGDTESAVQLIQKLGAGLSKDGDRWVVRGIPGESRLAIGPLTTVDVGNSGTSLYLGTAVACLFSRPFRFTGDESIRRRSAAPLLSALRNLGAEISEEGEAGCCPYTVQGPLKGGQTRLSAPTSQYLSALLLSLPLIPTESASTVTLDLLNEIPYIDMTLRHLADQQIRLERDGYKQFSIPGGQVYKPFSMRIPADFSSATFFFCAAAMTGSSIQITGLAPEDTQGDRRVLDFLTEMDCRYDWRRGPEGDWTLFFEGPQTLRAANLDLSQTPDALPAMAVTAASASGTSRLHNVAHARDKESDRIACMAAELSRLGCRVKELPDGLQIEGKPLSVPDRVTVKGYGDHRIIMALSLLNLLLPQDRITIDDPNRAAVTFPDFFAKLRQLRQG